MKKFCTAVVLAAGRGSRMGTALAKQYLTLGDKPVVVYSLEAFQASPVIDEIILITDKDHIEYCWEKLVHPYGITKVTAVAPGGKERYESVWKALCLLCGKNSRNEAGASAGDGYVFIHDGARPFITEDIIERVYKDTEKWDACVVGMPVKDTIKQTDENGVILDTPDRSRIWQAQTPQVFSVPLIVEAFQRQLSQDCKRVTDDSMIVENQMGVKVHMTEGGYTNIKITTPEDLAVAEAILTQYKK